MKHTWDVDVHWNDAITTSDHRIRVVIVATTISTANARKKQITFSKKTNKTNLNII